MVTVANTISISGRVLDREFVVWRLAGHTDREVVAVWFHYDYIDIHVLLSVSSCIYICAHGGVLL